MVKDPTAYEQNRKNLTANGYCIKCLDLTDPAHSDRYNPLWYLNTVEDIEHFAEVLLISTTPEGELEKEHYWHKMEKSLLVSITAYLCFHTEKEGRTITNLMRLLRDAAPDENEPDKPSVLDRMFASLEEKDPDSFAVRQYRHYKTLVNDPLMIGAGIRMQLSVLISCTARLQSFDSPEMETLTNSDDMALDSVDKQDTAYIVIAPDEPVTAHPLAMILFDQHMHCVGQSYNRCANADKNTLSVPLVYIARNWETYEPYIRQLIPSRQFVFSPICVQPGKDVETQAKSILGSVKRTFISDTYVATCEQPLLASLIAYIHRHDHEGPPSFAALLGIISKAIGDAEEKGLVDSWPAEPSSNFYLRKLFDVIETENPEDQGVLLYNTFEISAGCLRYRLMYILLWHLLSFIAAQPSTAHD